MQDKEEEEDDIEIGSKYASIAKRGDSSDSSDALDIDFGEIFTNKIKRSKKSANKTENL